MSKEAVASATPVVKEPTVSVAEAMGLPTDWSMKSSITPGSKPSASAKDDEDVEDDDALPGETKTDEPEEKIETPEPDKKPETTPTKKAPEAKKSKEAKKPAAEKTEPAAAAAPAKAAEQTPPPADKIKIKDKEYTPEELEAFIAKANAPAAAPVPAKPAADTPPPAKKEPTPEETQRQVAETKQKDDEWVARHSPHIEIPVDEPVLEKILTGGPEGVAAFKQTIAATVARAVLMTRKSMYNDLEPRFQQIADAQQPLISAQAKAEDERAWGQFKTDYPDLESCRDLVETAANTLVKKDPSRIREMSDSDFYKEVATQVRTFTDRFKPKDQTPAPAAAASITTAPVAAPAPVKAKVAPPGANVPTPAGSGGGKKGGGDSSIIASLL